MGSVYSKELPQGSDVICSQPFAKNNNLETSDIPSAENLDDEKISENKSNGDTAKVADRSANAIKK
ncbi:hypothetical protein TUM17386_02880 [Shewanella algae]|nr:hypothetical protein TUM17386_02880 [Shewanella algae]